MPCTLTVGATNEWCGNDHVILSSSRPIKAVSPGKFVAFYKDEECIGSASVLRPGPSLYIMNSQAMASSEEKTVSSEKSIFDKFHEDTNGQD